MNRRYPLTKIIVYHSSVQGEESVQGIKEGIAFFNKNKLVDTIVIARGGGAAEHLDSYNDESLVRVVASSTLPIITAIGHQIDTSLADMASDSRASTPTEAAILATPDKTELNRVIDDIAMQMDWSVNNYFDQKRRIIDEVLRNNQTYSPLSRLSAFTYELGTTQLLISKGIYNALADRRKELAKAINTIDDRYEQLMKPERWWLESLDGKRLSSLEVKKGKRYQLISDRVRLQILVEEKVRNDGNKL